MISLILNFLSLISGFVAGILSPFLLGVFLSRVVT